MPTPESIYWQDKFDDLRRTELDRVRATAAKWQATIATLLGVFGSVAFVGGISKVDDLEDGTATTAKTLVTVSVALAVVAVLCAAYAAQGLHHDKRGQSAQDLQTRSFAQARRALGFLRGSQLLGLVAAGCVIAGSLVVLYADKPDASPPRFLVTAPSQVWCVELATVDGETSLLAHGQAIEIPAEMSAVVPTESCGDADG